MGVKLISVLIVSEQFLTTNRLLEIKALPFFVLKMFLQRVARFLLVKEQ